MSRYVENDLDKETNTQISLHIKQCDNCRLLKEKLEELMDTLPELEEEIPFYLKNRLLYLPESQAATHTKAPVLRWVAAMIGTMILFLNLFYFTNILPPANKVLHTLVAQIEKFAVQTEALLDRLNDPENPISFADQNSVKSAPVKNIKKDLEENLKNNGGHNG